MKQAVQEIKHDNLSAREAIKELAYSFICSRQMSVQEVVYLCLPELWLRKCQPSVLHLNTNMPNERIRLLKSGEKFREMSENSTNICKTEIFENVYRSTNNLEVFGPSKSLSY